MDVSRRDRKTTKKGDPSYPIKNEVATAMVGLMSLLLITYTFHCTWVTSEAYSSPSIVLSAKQHDGSRVIFDDFREAYYWLRQNTPEVQLIPSHSVICILQLINDIKKSWTFGASVDIFGNACNINTYEKKVNKSP